MKKAIIFDSSSLISLAMNGLLGELKNLKKIFNGEFLITEEVKYEVVDKPMTIKRFELEAVRINNLIHEGIINLASKYVPNDSKDNNEFLNVANNIFSDGRENIKIISFGEASCLTLSKILGEKSIPNVVCVDERTTRLLCEAPEKLKELFERKLHRKLKINKKDFSLFNGFKIIRSSELMYVAYKKGLLNFSKSKDKKVLDALLYSLKFKGCSINDQEIKEIKKLG